MRKPNFIIIYCDDLGYGDLGCYGSQHVKTPHLDRLAEEGVRFTDWYSNSPVCSPSRAALLTGKYPARTGVQSILGGKRKQTAGLGTNQRTIAAELRDNGYATALFGKWHLGTASECRPGAHGFEEFYGFTAGCVDYYSHIYYWGEGIHPVHDLWHNETEVWDNGRYLTEVITDKCTQFIAGIGEKPFFLMAAYNAPHYPMHAPKEYMDRYAHLPWDRQVMAAMISAVDDGVGEIVQALKQAGVYEDTVIIFSSDNGPSTEARNWLDGTEDLYYGGNAGLFRGHKASLFDGGIREPAILSWPMGLKGGQVCEQTAVMFDVFPTLMSMAGIEPSNKNELDGVDLLPMLRAGKQCPHDIIYWEYGSQLAVREGKWKLVLNGKLDFTRHAPDPVHLSDLEQDPSERTNRAEQHPDVTERLEHAARQWLAALSPQ